MIKEWINKNRLKNMFITGEMSYNESYPYVVDFREKDEFTQYVFKLPQGLNPDTIENKRYLFTQTFGHNYVLDGDGITYSLKIFNKKIDLKFDYNFDELDLSSYSLPIIAGRDMFGNTHIYDMVTHPHLLIAGETGSGKSVTVRSIITTILLHMRKKVDLYLGDMKRSEFHVFRNVEGVKAVMTKKKDLYKCLNWLKNEMERRGDLMDCFEVEHIDEYNKLNGVTHEKYIVLAIDEVALLKKETELMDIVEEISCIGRALGVFLILSMQRPDSKVLEGQLKNNLTVRYAFRHSDKINSDITLGRGNAVDASVISSTEKGKFFMKNEDIKLLQAPFLPLKEARKLLEPYKKIVGAKDVTPEPEEERDFLKLPKLGE